MAERTGAEAAATPNSLGHRDGKGRRVREFNLSTTRAVGIHGMRVVEKRASREPRFPLPICATGRRSGAWGTPDCWSIPTSGHLFLWKTFAEFTKASMIILFGRGL